MIETNYICDRCNSKVESHQLFKLEVNIRGHRGFAKTPPCAQRHIHWCEACLKQLRVMEQEPKLDSDDGRLVPVVSIEDLIREIVQGEIDRYQ